MVTRKLILLFFCFFNMTYGHEEISSFLELSKKKIETYEPLLFYVTLDYHDSAKQKGRNRIQGKIEIMDNEGNKVYCPFILTFDHFINGLTRTNSLLYFVREPLKICFQKPGVFKIRLLPRGELVQPTNTVTLTVKDGELSNIKATDFVYHKINSLKFVNYVVDYQSKETRTKFLSSKEKEEIIELQKQFPEAKLFKFIALLQSWGNYEKIALKINSKKLETYQSPQHAFNQCALEMENAIRQFKDAKEPFFDEILKLMFKDYMAALFFSGQFNKAKQKLLEYSRHPNPSIASFSKKVLSDFDKTCEIVQSEMDKHR